MSGFFCCCYCYAVALFLFCVCLCVCVGRGEGRVYVHVRMYKSVCMYIFVASWLLLLFALLCVFLFVLFQCLFVVCFSLTCALLKFVMFVRFVICNDFTAYKNSGRLCYGFHLLSLLLSVLSFNAMSMTFASIFYILKKNNFD